MPQRNSTTGGITLRAATQSDAAGLAALHVASWRETYKGILPPEILEGLSVETRSAMWARILEATDVDRRDAIFVAVDGLQLIGFGSCGGQRTDGLAAAGFDGEIGAIYVRRAYQGMGLGRSIMGLLANALAGMGHTGASLWVLRENGRARAFYESLGGEIVDEKADEAGNNGLIEIAYGWREVTRLGASARSRSPLTSPSGQ